MTGLYGVISRQNSFRFGNKLIKSNCIKNTITISSSAKNSNREQFSDEYNKIHIETTSFQKIALSFGASLAALMNPRRGDMIAILGEASGVAALRYMQSIMLASEEGQQILKDAPRINSSTIDLEKLRFLPEGSVGKVYLDFLETNKVTPDSRLTVQFVDDVELAYVMQRYREVHDLNHAVLGMPTNMLGEVAVKWVEAFHTRLPMCIGGAVFGAMRLKPNLLVYSFATTVVSEHLFDLGYQQRQKYLTTYLPWAIQTGRNSKNLLCVYFEKRWEQQVSELHRELNIVPLNVV